ncbi:spore coat associated protein CotJA [Clostridium neuense]|uniref:Spore coat associated protein CotJA n=1 Tax=Clostridium neuense TaxID=1728934 RepID=A0ABW8TF49_9CLOT
MFQDDMYESIPDTDYSRRKTCIPQETVIANVRLASAYVPFQKMCSTLPPVEALKKGTIFPELYSPYSSKKRSENYLG